jgi:hypothetical protein
MVAVGRNLKELPSNHETSLWHDERLILPALKGILGKVHRLNYLSFVTQWVMQ